MEECFICCIPEGKSEREYAMELLTNKKTYSYPIIKLSQAYGCECVGIQAHNKCLLGINKCPTCRKIVIKPNLYVKTYYDIMFSWIFQLIKSNPKLIQKLEFFAVLIMFMLFGLCWLISKDFIKIQFNYRIHIIVIILLPIQFIGGICIIMKDYFKKYWLYDEKNNKLSKFPSNTKFLE